MNSVKLPTIKDIMAERHCSRNRAISLRALFEARMDEEYSRLTGKHFLEVITPKEFERTMPKRVKAKIEAERDEWEGSPAPKTARRCKTARAER